MASLATVAFAYALWEMMSFNPSSRLMPALAILPGLPLAAFLAIRALRGTKGESSVNPAEPVILAVLFLYALLVWAVGFSIPTALLIGWMLLVRAKLRWWVAALYGGAVFVLARVLFTSLRGDAPVGAIIPLS